MKDRLDSIKKVVIRCGKLILSADHDNLGEEYKEGNNNVVTKYDKEIENILREELLKIVPGAYFLGEESNNLYKENKYIFIVDPIDGTVNFSRNLNASAISVALLEDGEVVLGVCYNPYTNELYEAIKGNGAYLNGKQIHVSNKKLSEGLVFSGSAPYYDELREKSLDTLRKFAVVASDFRRCGSAVIEICAIASGKVEVYFELKLMPWDYAAASLILTEAGGCVTTINGEKLGYDKPTSILAHNNVENYLKYIEE